MAWALLICHLSPEGEIGNVWLPKILGSVIKQKKISMCHGLPVSFCVVVRNPPPLCFGVPKIEELAELCIRLYDIDFSTTHLHGCLKLETRMKIIPLHEINLCCLDIGHPSSSGGTECLVLMAVFVGYFNL
jgi:hypothetical protein